jgi:hypothetical protein
MDTLNIPSERSKRRRVQTTKYNMEFIENEEQLMLQQVSPRCGALLAQLFHEVLFREETAMELK